jgi:hypothetical protein
MTMDVVGFLGFSTGKELLKRKREKERKKDGGWSYSLSRLMA